MRRWFSILPSWIFSGLTVIAILWLTLAPKPLGENPPPLFPGADKLAHGIMFGGLASMMLFDWQRKHNWKPIKMQRALCYALLSGLLGVVIEFLQANMHLRRSFEYEDMVADVAGAFCFVILWIFIQKLWVANPYQ